jgi:hypothetical protein
LRFRFLFLVLIFISAASRAAEIISKDELHKVAYGLYWRRLLHYKEGFWGGFRSEADGDQFFLSPKGRNNPEAELEEDLKFFETQVLYASGDLRLTAQCKFPERFRYLKEILHLSTTPQECKDLQDWKNSLKAKSITLVFAAPYFGSPSSMFGHTFLRIDSQSRTSEVKNDLLDYGLSFEATMGPKKDLFYPIKGLLGMFPGNFSQLPFYLKINSYVNMESRDLWQYQIQLTESQLDQLLNHIWELSSTHFDYYFLNKNCSYQLMAILEVANPDWNLTENFSAKTIPIDTIRALSNYPGAISKITFRPSLLRSLEYRLARMSELEKQEFFRSRDNVSYLSQQASARTLDALMDWQKFHAMNESVDSLQADRLIDLSLLQQRSKLKEGSDDFPADEETHWPPRPENGHLSGKFSSHVGGEGSTSYVGFEARPAFHDLLDIEDGYLPNSALNIGRLRGSLLTDGSGTARLDEFILGEVVNLQTFTELQRKPSWRVDGGLARPADTGCTSCVAEYLEGGGGFSAGGSKLSFSALATAHAEFSNSFFQIYGNSYRAGPGLWLGSLWKGKALELMLNYEQIRFFPGPDQHFVSKVETTLAWAEKTWDFRLKLSGTQTSVLYFNSIDSGVGYFF